MDQSPFEAAPEPILPAGRQFVATWGLAVRHGGMTASLLHRAALFAGVGGQPVDILTFEPRPHTRAVEAHLRERGELGDGVRVRNIYEDFRNHAPPRSRIAVAPGRRPSHPPDERIEGEGTVLTWRDDAAEPFRIEHLRDDGSLAILDERGPVTGRLLTAFDQKGDPQHQWSGARAFYFDWLDARIGDEPAFLVVDSKTMAPTLRTYQRPDVTLVHVIHGSHLGRGRNPDVTAARAPILERLRDWDAVVFLTERQRHDVVARFGDEGNLAVAPNAVPLTPLGRTPRDPHRGVIVTRLARGKRLDHALQIVANARETGVPMTLDLYGDGPDASRLKNAIGRLGLVGVVHLRGYTDDPAAAYAAASWTLLTSAAEGESLAILEAMASGCIPLAYDIRYGPADAIDDGVNGRLVPDGDIDAAAAALAELCRTPSDRLDEMRDAARSRALEHSEDRILAVWADVERAAQERRRARPVRPALPGAPDRTVRSVAGGIVRKVRLLLAGR